MSGSRQWLRATTSWPLAANASASATKAVSAPPSGPAAAVRPSKAIPSSAITMRAIIGAPSLALQARLQVRQDRIEPGAERDQKPPGAFAIAAPADIAFPEARGDPPQVVRKAADVAAVAQ